MDGFSITTHNPHSVKVIPTSYLFEQGHEKSAFQIFSGFFGCTSSDICSKETNAWSASMKSFDL